MSDLSELTSPKYPSKPQKSTADVDHAFQYISSYDGSAQAALEASSTAIADKTARVNALITAMDHYYTNNSTSSSLYSSDDINPDNVFGLGLNLP